MIYTIPGQGFAGTLSVAQVSHIVDVTMHSACGATEYLVAINQIHTVLEHFNMVATG